MFDDMLGVGGNWTVQDEKISSAVVKQFDRLACGAACGEMLLQSRGVMTVKQRAIAKVTGIPVEIDQLAAGLNALSNLSGRWLGQRVFIPGGSHRQLIEALNHSGVWAAGMWEDGADMGHLVVVDGLVKDERLAIRDPYGRPNSKFGSQYKMEVEEFLRYWSFQAVYFLAS